MIHEEVDVAQVRSHVLYQGSDVLLLRAGEAAGLVLDDVNWRAGTIAIRGKGSRRDELPLVWDVGEAIASYLRNRLPGDAG